MNVSPAASELLDNAARLGSRDFDQFVFNVLALRARRKGLGLNTQEAVLLKKINQKSLSDEQQRRFDFLTQADSLTDLERSELLDLVAVVEQFDAERVGWLAELAQIRQVPVRTLMKQLGILPLKNV